MNKRYLITGANGFIGKYLTEELCKISNDVFVCFKQHANDIQKLSNNLKYINMDMMNKKQVNEAIYDSKPDVIFHLAAQSYPRISWEKPIYTMKVNLIGSMYLMDAIRKLNKLPVLIAIGSSAEYAPQPNESPIKEDWKLHASSIYGVSKQAMDEVARLYAVYYNIPIVRIRPFFIVGPRKERDFCSDIAKQIVLVERGKKKNISVGNLQVVRDLLDVRDSINALLIMSEKGVHGEVYNLCSGRGYLLSTILEIYKKHAKVPIHELIDANLLRNIDEKFKVGSPEKLFSLGWRIQYDINDTLLDILNYWRETL